MSLEPIRDGRTAAETSATRTSATRTSAVETAATETAATESRVANPETGSVWWAEILLGLVCYLAAAALCFSYTSLGPFARVTVVYGTVPAVLAFGVAAGLGTIYVRSGVRRSPYLTGDAGEDGAPGDAEVARKRDA